MFLKKYFKKQNNIGGFTLMESIVAISLFLSVILISSVFISMANRSYLAGSESGEIVQNARVAMDRITREIRQSVQIVTVLPPASDDPGNPPKNEIFFQDGHEINEFKYIKYYLSGDDLIREVIAYSFDIDPSVYVPHNSVDEFNSPPTEHILESRVVSEYLVNVDFWGTGGQVYVLLNFIKGKEEYSIRSCAFSRN